MTEKKKTHLFMLDKLIEPMNVDHTFSSFVEFRKWVGSPDLLSSGKVGDNILMFWKWQPSLKKAIRHDIKHITDFFEDLDEDDDYKSGVSGHPHNDKSNHLVYKNEDYLLIYTHSLNNGFGPTSYKITVKNEDEKDVRELLDIAIKETMLHIGLP